MVSYGFEPLNMKMIIFIVVILGAKSGNVD